MNNKYEIGRDVAIKYIMFKKRTEFEVKNKLQMLNYSPIIIDKVITSLKDDGYINDKEYIKKYFKELKSLKNWSIVQVKVNLSKRGCECTISDSELTKYEINSITNLYSKFLFKYPKATKEEKESFIHALQSKGFVYENIKNVIK